QGWQSRVGYSFEWQDERLTLKIGRIAAFLLVAVSLCTVPLHGQDGHGAQASWQAKADTMLPLLGHRNWILIVDSAYPLQTSPGVQTVETDSDELTVVRQVLSAIGHSIHVRPIVYMDAELPFVPESDAPGVTEYRQKIRSVLGDRQVTVLPHEQLIHK